MRVAAIDCGTNSIRLLISDISEVSGVAVDVHRQMRTVRLGEGIDATGKFAVAALDRTFAACADYAATIASCHVEATRFVATSASRDADNRDEFIAGVEQLVGVTPEVISGDEEAKLTFTGALATHSHRIGHRRALVVDIGGGSTEFVLGNVAHGIVAAHSVDIGCVRMTERHFRDDPPTVGQVAAAVTDIDAGIRDAARRVDLSATEVLVGLAGSVTTVAAMAMGLPAYDAARIDGSVVAADDVHCVARDLLAMTRDQRAELPFMHPGRVDVIGGGALVLSRIVERLGMPVLVSEHDILDGIAWSLATG